MSDLLSQIAEEYCDLQLVLVTAAGGGSGCKIQHTSWKLVSVPTTGQSGRFCQDDPAAITGKH